MIETLLALDARLVLHVQELRSPPLDALMAWATTLGRSGFVWLGLAAGVALARPALAGGVLQLVLGLLLSFVLVDLVLKPAIARERPFIIMSPVAAAIETAGIPDSLPATKAFPSGHASNAILGAFVVGRMWRRARPLLWFLALLVAGSRVYLGVHFPLDVLAGGWLGYRLGWWVTGNAWWDEPDAGASGVRAEPAGV